MKKLLCSFSLVTFVGLLLIGCSDKTVTPVESSAGSLQKENSGSGSAILRYESEGAYGFYDEDTHLLLAIGINDPSSFCSGGGGMDWFEVKELLLPNADPELRRLVLQIRANDVTAIIWQADFPPEDFCAFMLDNEPLASGMVNFMYSDNDCWSVLQGNLNSNAFGYKAQGSLESTGGQSYNLNFFDHITWDWDRTWIRENVKIQLVPNGN